MDASGHKAAGGRSGPTLTPVPAPVSRFVSTRSLRPNEQIAKCKKWSYFSARLCQTWTMSGYGQFCPVAKGAKVFAERWTPLLLRELLCGSHHFSELMQGLPRMSQSLLVQIPDRRVVIQFDSRGLPHEWYRYILNRPNVEVCLRDYGFEVDLFVMADLMALTQVHLGRLHMLQALKDGLVEIHGPVELRRAFPT